MTRRKLSQQWRAAYSFHQSGVEVKEGRSRGGYYKGCQDQRKPFEKVGLLQGELLERKQKQKRHTLPTQILRARRGSLEENENTPLFHDGRRREAKFVSGYTESRSTSKVYWYSDSRKQGGHQSTDRTLQIRVQHLVQRPARRAGS